MAMMSIVNTALAAAGAKAQVYWTDVVHELRKGQILEWIGLVVFGLLCTAEMAYAANDLSSIGQHISKQTGGVLEAAKQLFNLVGFCLAGFGMFKIFTRKPNEPVSDGFKWLGGGALVLSLGLIIQAVGGSVFGGSDQSKNALDRLKG